MIALQRRERPVLGLFLSHLEGAYQQRLYKGFDSFCREEGCDLVAFCSRYSPGGGAASGSGEAVFRLADGSRIDGLCVDSSAFMDEEGFARFIESAPGLAAIPLVLSSIESDLYPSVLPDNQGGMRAALEHLLRVHGARSIAFAGGPSGVGDSRRRLEEWRSFMDSEGLPRDASMEFEGRFDIASGAEAVRRFLSAGTMPDAIAFASDEMAMGGIRELARRGIRVPEDVAVTGFDDNALSAQEFPPIASASQPVEEKARACARILLRAIEGYRVERRLVLPVEFVARESCGCASARVDAREQLLRSRRAIESMKRVAEGLGSILSIEDLGREFPALFPAISPAPAFICLRDRDPSHSLVVAASDGSGKALVSPSSPKRFLSSQLVPSYLLGEGRLSLVVQALYRGSRDFGFLACVDEGSPSDVYAALGYQVSAAINSIALIEERDEGERRLKAALSLAEESEKRFRELADLLPAFVMESDREGRIAYVNETGLGMLGLDAGDIAGGTRVEELFAELGGPDARSGCARLLARGRQGQEVSLLVKKRASEGGEGLTRWIGMDFKPLVASMVMPDEEMLKGFKLSARERQILALELEGLIGKEIAERLSISLSTVKGHVGSLYRKLGIGSREQLFSLMRERIIARWGYESLLFSLVTGLLRE
jgi:PAS domain S-box-containing protein